MLDDGGPGAFRGRRRVPDDGDGSVRDGDGVCGPEQHRPRRAAHLTLFDLVKTGNAYRHLDTGDQLEGRAFRKLVGVPEGQRPTDAQFVQQLMLSLLGMAWFKLRDRLKL